MTPELQEVENNGFYNLGNSCYMNSSFHFVFSVSGIRDEIMATPILGICYEDRLLEATHNIFSHIEQGTSPYYATEFMEILQLVISSNLVFLSSVIFPFFYPKVQRKAEQQDPKNHPSLVNAVDDWMRDDPYLTADGYTAVTIL